MTFWAVVKTIAFKVKLVRLHFGQFFLKTWATFIPTSGHAGQRIKVVQNWRQFLLFCLFGFLDVSILGNGTLLPLYPTSWSLMKGQKICALFEAIELKCKWPP